MIYRELIAAIPEDKLDDPVQIVKHHPVEDKVLECLAAVCVGTVGELELLYVRSSIDNTKRPNDFVIYVDSNPHALDGAIAYEIGVQDVSNKKPIYGKDGYKPEADWTENGTAKDLVDLDYHENYIDTLSESEIKLIQERIKRHDELKQ